MKLFIIGATGYLGAVVAEYLQREGHELVGLARSDKSAEALTAAGITPVRGEIGDYDVIKEQAELADGVVQLGIGAFFDHSDTKAMIRNTQALIDACKGTNKPVVQTYGIAQYLDTGAFKEDRIATEEDRRSWPWVYAHIEDCQRMFEAEPSVRHIGIVPGGIFGRGGGYIGAFTRMFGCIRQYGKLYAVAPGNNGGSCVFIDDLADLYVRVLKSPETQGFYIGSGEIIIMKDAAEYIAKAAGVEIEWVDYPTIEKLCGRYAVWEWWTNLRCSGDKARRELGWKTTRTVKEEFEMLPQPLDVTTVYPRADRLAAQAAFVAMAGAQVTGEGATV